MWAAQPKQGDSKHFCTLNICFRPSGEQPRLAIIFRGKGIHLSAVEKASWDKDVDVFFQPNDWADRVCRELGREDTETSCCRCIKRELHGLEFLVPLTSGNQSMVVMGLHLRS